MSLQRVLCKTTISLFIISSLVSHADAGTVGNGGDAIVCPDGSVQMLDSYEGQTRYGFKYRWPLDSQDGVSSALAIVDGLKFRDPNFAEELNTKIRQFMDQTTFVKGSELFDIPDSDHSAIPRGCKIEQIAIQREPKFYNERRYLVSEDLYAAMSPSQQGALILHEVIYTLALKRGHENSIATRYFASFLSSTALQEVSLVDYVRVLHQVNIQELKSLVLMQRDIKISFGDSLPHEDSVYDATIPQYVLSNGEILKNDNDIPLHAKGMLFNGRFEVSHLRDVKIHVDNIDGKIIYAYYLQVNDGTMTQAEIGSTTFVAPNGCKLEISRNRYFTVSLTFDAKHRATSIWTNRDDLTNVASFICSGIEQVNQFALDEHHKINFHPNGAVSEAFVDGHGVFRRSDGHIVKRYNTNVRFDEEGMILD